MKPLASILCVLAWTPAVFAALEIQPTQAGNVGLVSGVLAVGSGFHSGVESEHFADRERRGVLEFDLSAQSTSADPVYLRFYVSDFSDPSSGVEGVPATGATDADSVDQHVYAYQADNAITVDDFGRTSVLVETWNNGLADIWDNLVAMNIDVTSQFNASVGGSVGFLLVSDFGGNIAFRDELLVDIFDRVEGLDRNRFPKHFPLPGALTLGTDPITITADIQTALEIGQEGTTPPQPVGNMPEPTAFAVWAVLGIMVAGRLRWARLRKL